MTRAPVFLCISSYFKGVDFLVAGKEAGNTIYLVTSKKLEQEAWPGDHIDEIFYVEEGGDGRWNNDHLINGLAYFMQDNPVDKIIALDDFDVERAALLREHFRIPGMGQTTARYFRDKLAMRLRAREGGLAVPPFTALFTNEQISTFVKEQAPPWVLKPRSEASATGIKKISSEEELWQTLEHLGDQRHHHLLETFVSGDVYHVDSLSYEGKNIFTRSARYLNTPFEVAHQGGIFRTMTLDLDSEDHYKLNALNQQLMQTFGMQYSASHSEYIKHAESGDFYFLETSSRVGGAHIAEMVEAASNINLWREWARIETAVYLSQTYQLPQQHEKCAATIISLSKFATPDTSTFNDPEIWWRMNKDHHIGFILQSDSNKRIAQLLDVYGQRIASEFHASIPAPDKSTH